MSRLNGLGLALVLCTGIGFAGCNAKARGASAADDKRSGILTKEEVTAILGQPVTAVEGQGQHLQYKTQSVYLEASIEVEHGDGKMAMDGARKATAMLGGVAEAVPNLGDEAFFGAMFTLYVRKGDKMAIIQAPNYQMDAQANATNKVFAGSTEERKKALDEMLRLSKNDPTQAGLQGGDATQGALAVIKAGSKKQGTEYETHTRTVAVALATKLMEKL